MTGKPLQYARQALHRALADLAPGDEVNVIAYDHEQASCCPPLVFDICQPNRAT